jgi:hypothetical protein
MCWKWNTGRGDKKFIWNFNRETLLEASAWNTEMAVVGV